MSEYGRRGMGERRQQRPLGAPCSWCRAKPALPNKRYPHLATNWCSETHRWAEMRARKREKATVIANNIRRLLGLHDGRGDDFTVPELETIERRLRRILPYQGKALYPARQRRPGDKRSHSPHEIPRTAAKSLYRSTGQKAFNG